MKKNTILFIVLVFFNCETKTPSIQHSVYCSEPKHQEVFGEELDYFAYFDYDQGLKCAKEQGKPMLLVFSGWACVNMRKVEKNILTLPKIKSFISENFVFTVLYVDDRTKLKEEIIDSSFGRPRRLRTIGEVYSDLQIKLTRSGSQPVFTVIDNNGEPILENEKPLIDYDILRDETAFLNWMKDKKEVFKCLSI